MQNSRLDKHLALSVMHCNRAKHWPVSTKYESREAGCVTIVEVVLAYIHSKLNHVKTLKKVVYLKKVPVLAKGQGPKAKEKDEDRHQPREHTTCWLYNN